MSYEGYREYLCSSGHYWTADAYDDDLHECPHCGARMTHWHSVDATNGRDESDPNTMPAPKEAIGRDDKWALDHYGNRYAIPVPKYRPLSQWRT